MDVASYEADKNYSIGGGFRREKMVLRVEILTPREPKPPQTEQICSVF